MKTSKIILLAIVFILANFASIAQSADVPVPATVQSKSILLRGGTAHIGNGSVVENAAIGFVNGKITLVTTANSLSGNAGFDEVIDVTGKHIYPGFIAVNSTLGLTEIDAVRATRDFQETGNFNPHVRSVIAYNTDSRITPTIRANGVLLAQITPRGGLITGTSSVVELDAWNWEDAVLRTDDAIHLNWPNIFAFSGWWAEPGNIEKNKEYDKQVNEIKSFFSEAKAFNELKNPAEKNLKLEAMRGLFNGTQTLFISANHAKEITQAVNFARSMGIIKIAIVGGEDSWLVTDLLKENNVSVVVKRLHSLPSLPEDDIDLPFKLPSLLQKAGVLFCLNYEGDMEVMGTRNLAFTAGTAATYGLTKEQALASISMNAAKILGIDTRVGSIEVGKDATIFVSSGDALDMKTNSLEHAFIRGRKIDLDNHQRQLYKKFSGKYGDK
jgi:imidazolonepropionase-like amidohydrolase